MTITLQLLPALSLYLAFPVAAAIDPSDELVPWLLKPATCPCSYAADVPLTPEAWSDELGDPKLIVLACDEATAVFQAADPLPQLPFVSALITTETPPETICQGVDAIGKGEVHSGLSAAELAACRDDALAYAIDFLTLFPDWPHVDACSSL